VTIRNLDKIFQPRRVAVIGASDEPAKVGYTVLRNLVTGGFPGVVYPVNPKREAVQGIAAYKNIAALPNTPDLAIICTPGSTVPGLIRELGARGTLGVVITSAGFREMGEEGKQLEAEVRKAKDEFPGLRIIGPNCLGIIVPGMHLNASFAGATPQAGHVAFISQSGALCTAVLDWAIEEGIGFSHFVSIGNMLDVGFGDLIDYFGQDPATKSILLYVESVIDPRQFMSAARAFAREKPIIAYKAGRFADSAKAAASHTGALAGVDAVYEAAFERAGIVRIFEVDDMFDCAELLARQQPPTGSALAIVTNAGGPGVMASDALIAAGGKLATLADTTIRQLDTVLPPFWSHNNPIDVLGDAPPERYADAMTAALNDPGVDAVLVILTPQAMTDPTGTARAIAAASKQAHGKPILTAWMGAGMVAQGQKILSQAGLPTYHTPEHAVRAFMYLVRYARNLETLYETPRELPMAFTLDRTGIVNKFRDRLAASEPTLSEGDSKELLEAYGIPTTRPWSAATSDEAVERANQVGYPVVLKILSPDITHKTDVGGVVLNLSTPEAVQKAFDQIVKSAKEKKPEARIEGVTVQRMVSMARSFELIVGAKQDPVFGPVLLVGAGGTAAEVFQDRALALPPLNERLARGMLQSLKSWPLLTGYRGRPAVNLDELIEVLMRVSYLVADFPEIVELDINPLLVSREGAMALDARIIVDPELVKHPPGSFAHLAIQPYPEHYVRHGIPIKNGQTITLRPIRAEDEPRWQEFLEVSSEESIYYRFRYLFNRTSHAMAKRHCFIDYTREMAIVAELEGDDPRIIAVGRLLADPDHDQAEYAIMVADPWQGQGVGHLVTNYSVEIAAQWGLRSVVGETTPDNTRMIHLFRKEGFTLEERPEDDVVFARKLVENGAD
jgi:acetyltransferase